jgi:DNA replication and repair protein RecF
MYLMLLSFILRQSYFNPLAVQNKHGEEFFVIDAEFIKNERNEQVVCSLKKGQKKVLKRNGKAYDKFSSMLVLFPLVTFHLQIEI